MTGDATLAALLDTLLPGDGIFPAAGTHGLAGRLRSMAALRPGGTDALARIAASLPAGFAAADAATRATLLEGAEAAHPQDFERVVTAAFNAYYTAPDIRAVIARETGFAPRPPQPRGHDLPPFDERLLDAVRARGPFWRSGGGE